MKEKLVRGFIIGGVILSLVLGGITILGIDPPDPGAKIDPPDPAKVQLPS